jgi:hypothetical protein
MAKLMLRGKPVTIDAESGCLFFKIDGFDMLELRPVVFEAGHSAREEKDFKELTADEFQAIIDQIALVFE